MNLKKDKQNVFFVTQIEQIISSIKMTQIQNEFNQLKRQSNNDKNEITTLQKENKKLSERNKQLKQQVNELMITHHQSAVKIAELNETILLLKTENEEQNEQSELNMINGEKQIKNVQLTNIKLKNEIIDYKRRIIELENMNKKLIHENQQLKEQKIDENSFIRNELLTKTDELEQLKITHQKTLQEKSLQEKKQERKLPNRSQAVVELALEIELQDKEDEIELLKLEKQKYVKDILILENDLIDIEKKYKSTYSEFLLKNHQEEVNMKATIRQLKEENNHLKYIIEECEDVKEYEMRDQYHKIIFDNLPEGCEFQYKKINGRKSEIFSLSFSDSSFERKEKCSPRDRDIIELPKVKLIGNSIQLQTFPIRRVDLMKHKMIIRKKSGSELIEGFPFDIYVILSDNNTSQQTSMKTIDDNYKIENISILVDLQTILLGGTYTIHHDGKMKTISIPKGLPENEIIMIHQYGWNEEFEQYHLAVKVKYNLNGSYSRIGNDLIGTFKYNKQFENRLTVPPYIDDEISFPPQQLINGARIIFEKKGFEWNNEVGNYIFVVELN